MTDHIEQGKLTVLTGESSWREEKHMIHLTIGHFTWISFLAFGDAQECLDQVIDFLAEYHPGALYDEQVNEEFDRLKAEGASDDEAWEGSAIDMMSGGNCGNWLRSEEVHFTFDPSREDIKRYTEGDLS